MKTEKPPPLVDSGVSRHLSEKKTNEAFSSSTSLSFHADPKRTAPEGMCFQSSSPASRVHSQASEARSARGLPLRRDDIASRPLLGPVGVRVEIRDRG